MQLAHNPYHKSTGVARQKRVFGNDRPETQTQEANAWKKGSEAYPYFVADDGLQMKPGRPGHGRMTDDRTADGPGLADRAGSAMADVMSPPAIAPGAPVPAAPQTAEQMKTGPAEIAPRAGWREKLALAQRLSDEAMAEREQDTENLARTNQGVQATQQVLGINPGQPAAPMFDMGGDCYDEGGEPKEKWAQEATDRMKEKGTVGSFTKQASSAGYSSPLEYARHVMAAPGKHSATTVKRANFAKNINK